MFKKAVVPTVAALTAVTWKISEKEFLEEAHRNTVQEDAANAVRRFMLRNGVPGLSVGVSINGNHVWTTGFGYADVEQLVPCTDRTVMRVASISKSITSLIAARLVQFGKLDLDLPIQKYFPDYPIKKCKAVPVDITCRQLLSHTSGIRHYKEGTSPPSPSCFVPIPSPQ